MKSEPITAEDLLAVRDALNKPPAPPRFWMDEATKRKFIEQYGDAKVTNYLREFGFE